MSNKTLKQRCKVNTNIDTDTFVGITCVNDDISVNFPLGFHLEDDEKKLRKDILLLMNVLFKNTDKKESELNNTVAFNDVNLPIQAYLYIISDYYARGYYKERETIYEVAKRGKINWNRTTKNQRAYIQDNDIYYLDYVTKKRMTNENELITLIHEYCVYESFSKMGWLFTSFVPPKPSIKVQKKMFAGILKKKIAETFNDRNKQLFVNMLSVINSLGDDGGATDFKYGTYRFEYVWESMIDKVYGIKNNADYFPRTKWVLSDGEEHENSYLRPDTIMVTPNGIYVLDAKYYKFGDTNKYKDLPQSASINKQITYGEYIHSKRSKSMVYNAFIMPYDAFGETFPIGKELHHIGNAESDWKSLDGTKPYERVVGILLDVKSLMKAHSHDKDKIMELAELIEEKGKSQVR